MFYTFFFSYYILKIQCVFNTAYGHLTRHISSALWPHVASGWQLDSEASYRMSISKTIILTETTTQASWLG